MTRMETLIHLSGRLKGHAREARVDAEHIESAMIVYIREYVRRCMREPAHDFEKALSRWWNDEVHSWGNKILKAMDKDKREGGMELKAKVADRVMKGKIIERSLLKRYKTYFKGSKLTKPKWAHYDHFILLRAVGDSFLYSLDPSHTTWVYSMDMNLSTGEIGNNGMKEVGYPTSCWIFTYHSLEEVGMCNYSGAWTNLYEVEYFHYSSILGDPCLMIDPSC